MFLFRPPFVRRDPRRSQYCGLFRTQNFTLVSRRLRRSQEVSRCLISIAFKTPSSTPTPVFKPNWLSVARMPIVYYRQRKPAIRTKSVYVLNECIRPSRSKEVRTNEPTRPVGEACIRSNPTRRIRGDLIVAMSTDQNRVGPCGISDPPLVAESSVTGHFQYEFR